MPTPSTASRPAVVTPPASRRSPLRRRTGTTGRSPWRSLRHSGMRWWSLANLVSNAGTWMQLTAQNLLVLQLTGSAALTGLCVAAQAAPGLLLGPLGGAVVDAWPRKVTAAVSQLLLALVAVATAALIALGMLNIPVLLVLAAVSGLIATVDAPACALLGNDLVPREDVPSAIALGSLVTNAGRLGGVALAGVATAALGAAAAYAVNGASFLFVAAVIPFLRLLPGAEGEPASGTARRPAERPRVREGLAFFLGRPQLAALAAVAALSAVLGRNYALTLAALVTGPLHGGPEAYGAISTVLAVGGIAGAVIAGRMQRPGIRLIAALAAAGGLLQALAALSPSLLPLAVLVVPMAVVETVSDTATTTMLQTDPPAELRGRVLGTWRSMSTVWNLAGPPLLGLLLQAAGPRAALLSGGLVIAGLIGVAALARRGAARGGRVRAPEPASAMAAAPVPAPAMVPAA
ncbi:MFS transporter [Peterkaempfera griseoplana]|uniref:MFS transporter n=1 Tax=Peterkaempfera griseoplana TaxID=66896 RepID=UPI0006E175D3|nr:MFS transporter [Peterkaempfera griseoplana]